MLRCALTSLFYYPLFCSVLFCCPRFNLSILISCLLLSGRLHVNRAVDGDVVAIQVRESQIDGEGEMGRGMGRAEGEMGRGIGRGEGKGLQKKRERE